MVSARLTHPRGPTAVQHRYTRPHARYPARLMTLNAVNEYTVLFVLVGGAPGAMGGGHPDAIPGSQVSRSCLDCAGVIGSRTARATLNINNGMTA